MDLNTSERRNRSVFYNFLTEKKILEMTNDRYFERGSNYFFENRVSSLKEYKGEIIASVEGTHKYSVKFWLHNNNFEYSCNCPVGSEGAFCKHCVAAALEFLSSERKN